MRVEIDETLKIVLFTDLRASNLRWVVVVGVVGASCKAVIAILAVTWIAVPVHVGIPTYKNR